MKTIEPELIVRRLMYLNGWTIEAPAGFKIVLQTYDSIPTSMGISNHIDLKIEPIQEEKE